MLDFVPYGPQQTTIYSTDASHPIYYPPHLVGPPPTLQPYSLPFPSNSPSSSPDPSPASLVFDPFADDSDSAASSDSRSDAARHLHNVELLRQHERMHRVVAWVDGVNYGHGYGLKAPAPVKNAFYTPQPADTPFVYYSSSAPSVSTCSDDEPYLIYSTPLPGAAAPAPAPPPAPRRHHAPAKSLSVPALRAASRAHRRYVSLSSIREEDESRA
ncbi:hypothetical protein K488DRAFT_72172 [Vararia minispora EC-137]|uniref:Uncharacterized protein n=1 Tax=Vararia minispora EC-137 TaxID=1314806 RepID=A0ACB8QF47_9AGAM|nr:hypothetical protein K488DRAFT_72172 [Vararia minispora EC-137]